MCDILVKSFTKGSISCEIEQGANVHEINVTSVKALHLNNKSLWRQGRGSVWILQVIQALAIRLVGSAMFIVTFNQVIFFFTHE